MARFVRPRPVAWFFFIAAFATTLALGSWQVKRLQWKEGVLAEIEAAKAHSPLTTIPDTAETLDAANFFPATVAGVWRGEEFHISPRFFQGKLGYFLVSPLTLTDGRTLLVNRGWIPAEKKEPETRPETQVNGPATLHGMLRVGDDRNTLTPQNSPERNLWFGRDAEAMGSYAGLERTIPAMLDIVGEQHADQLPVPSNGEIKLRNDHLSYIITWYGIALSILIIFLVYHRKK